MCRGGSRIFEKGGGVHLRSTSKKKGAGSRRGSNFGPNVKNLYHGPKWGADPLDPPPQPPTPDPPMTCQELVDLSTRVRERVLHLSGLDPQLKSNQNPIIGQNHKSKGSEA